jgi:hypothetical protein
VPGAGDGAADRYDTIAGEALAGGDPAALAGADDGGLFVAGRAAWRVLAGAVAAARTASSGKGAYRGELRYAKAPFEVSYYVATLRLAAPAVSVAPAVSAAPW